MENYYDCAPQNGFVSSSYTSYGIKCIDSEYCRRIQNINNPVKKLIRVDRVPHYRDGTYSSDYWDEYTELPLDEDFRSYDRSVFVHNDNEIYSYHVITEDMQRRIDRGRPYNDKYIIVKEYTYTHPIYSAKHNGEDPEALEKEIKDNHNLHQTIKDNLLLNLKNILQKWKK